MGPDGFNHQPQPSTTNGTSPGKKVSLSGAQIVVTLADGTSLPLQRLSSGEKHIVKILLDAVTIEQSAIMIDEPELSMHIDWQRTLIATIRQLNPSCQIILASHSPEIMADLDDTKIFRL